MLCKIERVVCLSEPTGGYPIINNHCEFILEREYPSGSVFRCKFCLRAIPVGREEYGSHA